MDISVRKLNLIEEFLEISDEKIIEKLESFFKSERKRTTETNINPMSLDEFNHLISNAKDDVRNGKTVSHNDLKQIVRQWK